MNSIKIEFLPRGETKKARDAEKGRLLEQLVGDYLRASGYYDVELNKRVSGTEWDVYGRAALTGAPVIISCKCLSRSVSPEPLKGLGFDVIAQAEDFPNVSGVLIAIPRVSADAKKYWESVPTKMAARIRLLEETELVREMCKREGWLSDEAIRVLAKRYHDLQTGDTRFVCSDRGAFWAQFLLDDGSRAPSQYCLFSMAGLPITDSDVLGDLQDLVRQNGSDLAEVPFVNLVSDYRFGNAPKCEIPPAHLSVPGVGWFDYKYPAPADHFAGREPEIEEFKGFIEKILAGKTASRVVVVTGTSGIGKSSLLHKFKEAVRPLGGCLVPINCMSARGKTFVLSAVLRMLKELEDEPECKDVVPRIEISGLDSLADTMYQLGCQLKEHGIIPILVFDQFETALLDGPLAEALVEFVLAVEELQADIVLGFAWKTDLWWPDDHVPYSAREQLRKTSFTIQLEQFGPSETNVLLKALSDEMNQPLISDLANELRWFSRGYPWLLKKVCWHIVEQIRRGMTQSDILDRKLDLRALFEADLEQLDENEKDVLRKLAAVMPTDRRSIAEAFSEFSVQDLLNKFVDMRLVVRQGETYNIYHDIFKEFLRTGRVPIEESYLLRVSPGKALDIVQILADTRCPIRIENLASVAKMKVTSLYNYLRDLTSIGLVVVDRGHASLDQGVRDLQTQEDLIREARRRLVRNTCVKEILRLIDDGGNLTVDAVADILRQEFPSVEAHPRTWNSYARSMIRWLNQVRVRGSDTIVLQGELSASRLVGSETTAEYPKGQVTGVIRLTELLLQQPDLKKPDISDKLARKPKTVEKALVDTRLLGFCERLIGGGWRLTEIGREFASSSDDKRREIFRNQMLEIPFIKEFLGHAAASSASVHSIIVGMLHERGRKLRPMTTQTISAIVKNWSKYAGISLESSGQLKLIH
jgi:hypothetical protein